MPFKPACRLTAFLLVLALAITSAAVPAAAPEDSVTGLEFDYDYVYDTVTPMQNSRRLCGAQQKKRNQAWFRFFLFTNKTSLRFSKNQVI